MSEFQYLDGGNTEAQDRLATSFLLAQDSVGLASDGVLAGLAVSQQTTASKFVNVAVGAAVVQDSVSNGVALMVNDAIKAVDVLQTDVAESNPRNDLIVFDSATKTVRKIKGTANVTPSDPTVPATAVKLARVRVKSATTYAGNEVVAAADIDSLIVKTRLFGMPIELTGTVSLAGDGTNQRFVDVTYSTAFPGTPTLVLQELTGMSDSSTTQTTWPSNESATGFRCNAVRNNTTTLSVRWVARYYPA